MLPDDWRSTFAADDQPLGHRVPEWPAFAAIPWWAVVSAGLSPLLLTVGWLAADDVQPAAYSPIRQTVSYMAGSGGTDRWIMTLAMLLTGGTYLVTAVGMSGLWAPARALLVISGLCSLGIATSPEPAAGPTVVHLCWTVLGSVVITIWPLVAAKHAPPHLTALAGRYTAAATILFAAMLGWAAIETQSGSSLGLAERALSTAATSWPFVVALLLRRRAVYGADAAASGSDLAMTDRR